MPVPETKLAVLKLHQIPVSPRFQVREAGVDAFHVSQLAQAYLAWREDCEAHPELPCPVPPPRVWKIGGQYHLTRGFHRLDAMKAAKLTEAEFEVVTGGTIPQAAVDAAEGNLDHKALKMKKGDLQKSFVMLWNNSPLVRKTATAELARKFAVDRKTIDRWAELAEAEGGAKREAGTRIDKNGNEVKVGGGTPTHKSPPPPADLFDSPERADDGGEPDGGSGEMRTPDAPEPEKQPEVAARADGEYPPDPRFMPNAEGAMAVAATLASVKARLEQVRGDLRRLFADPQHPVAVRLHYHTTFDGNLTAMIEDIVNNSPTHVCPLCVGTAERENGDPCGTCGRYGLVAAGDADQSKAHWKRTGRRYDDLCKKADLAEVEA